MPRHGPSQGAATHLLLLLLRLAHQWAGLILGLCCLALHLLKLAALLLHLLLCLLGCLLCLRHLYIASLSQHHCHIYVQVGWAFFAWHGDRPA